MLMVLDALLHL